MLYLKMKFLTIQKPTIIFLFKQMPEYLCLFLVWVPTVLKIHVTAQRGRLVNVLERL
jgi:hypothetical protein